MIYEIRGEPEAMGLLHTTGRWSGLPRSFRSKLLARSLQTETIISTSYRKYLSSLFQQRTTFNSYNVFFCGCLIANVWIIQLQKETAEVAKREHICPILPFLQWIYGLSAWYVPYLFLLSSRMFSGPAI